MLAATPEPAPADIRQPLPLPYERRRRLWSRLFSRRRIQLALLLCSILLLAYAVYSSRDFLALCYWRRECRLYRPDNAGDPSCVETARWGGQTSTTLLAGVLPTPLAELSRYQPLVSQPNGRAAQASYAGPVLFMHERRTAGGRRYLVILRRVPPGERESWDLPSGISLEAMPVDGFFDRRTLWSKTLLNDPFPDLFDEDVQSPALTIYPGRCDPSDESRIVIPYRTSAGDFSVSGVVENSSGGSGSVRVRWE